MRVNPALAALQLPAKILDYTAEWDGSERPTPPVGLYYTNLHLKGQSNACNINIHQKALSIFFIQIFDTEKETV
jgi:hypothetical protein